MTDRQRDKGQAASWRYLLSIIKAMEDGIPGTNVIGSGYEIVLTKIDSRAPIAVRSAQPIAR